MDVNALIAQAQASVEHLEDQTQVQQGGFEYEVPPAGLTPARFVGYVEMGVRHQKPYQGKEKPDAEEVRLYFELNGPKHQREVDIDGEKKTFTNMISIKLRKKFSDRGDFTKLFRKMVYGRDSITHMAAMLGQGFLIKVVHSEEEKPEAGKKPRTFANMRDADGTFTIQAPRVEDPMTGDVTDVPVPEATVPIKLLLWDAPTQEQWDSIFIDGSRTVKDEKGNETEVSRNWLQEDIIANAVNFQGSPLQSLLGGVADLTLDAPEDEAPEVGNESAGAVEDTPAPSTESADSPDAEANESEKTSNDTSEQKTQSAADLMKELGLG